MSMRTLIIEDESVTRRVIVRALRNEGISVTAVSDLTTGQSALETMHFDIVILDVTLPDGSGLDLLKALRQTTSTAHVIIVSGASSEVDRVRALLAGADDYVVKPFFPRELAARALAVGRRLQQNIDTVLRDDWLRIDMAARQVTVRECSVMLTAKEFDLLAYLASSPGQVFSREELLRSVWKSTSAWQRPTTVTEHVRRLRAKLGDCPPSLLVAVRSVGYRYDSPRPSSLEREERTHQLSIQSSQ
jgi:DNA-binding response OmpR family regulator